MEDTALLQMCATVALESLIRSQDAKVQLIFWLTLRVLNCILDDKMALILQWDVIAAAYMVFVWIWTSVTVKKVGKAVPAMNVCSYLPSMNDDSCIIICRAAICLKSCENGGKCIGPNQCSCPAGWEGQSCDQRMCTAKKPPCDVNPLTIKLPRAHAQEAKQSVRGTASSSSRENRQIATSRHLSDS